VKKEIGFFTNGYTYNDSYTTEAQPGIYGVTETLAGISKAGFKYVEILTTHKKWGHLSPRLYDMDKKSATKNINLLKKFGLSLNGVYHYQGEDSCFLREEELNVFKKVVDGAKLLGLKYLITDTDIINTEEKQKKFYKNIQVIADYAGAMNIIICLDIHGKWCRDGKRTSEIIREVNHPNLKINYCTGNAIYWGNSKPEEDIKYALPFIARIHLKDSSGKYQDYNFPALGEGVINFEKIFNLIKDFNGPISAEVELDGMNNSLQEINKAVTKSYKFLRDSCIFDS